MPIKPGPPPTYPPAPGDPPYLTRDEAATVTLGRKLRLRATWPVEGNMGLGPEVEVIGISNCPHSQTNRLFLMRDKHDRIQLLDAAWCLAEPWMDPFFEP